MSYRAGNFSNTTSSSVQLAVSGAGKMSLLLTARALLFKQNDMIRAAKRKAGMVNTNMTLREYNHTHHTFLRDWFKPTALVTNDQIVVNPIGTSDFDQTVEFILTEVGDFMTNVSAVVDLPEVKCLAAELPNIVVYSKYQSVNDLNTGKPLDFGAGALGLTGAAATIPDGHVYYMLAGVPQNTVFTNSDGLEYVIQPGGIKYNYVDSNGALLAGPDGTQVVADANGFGQGTAQDPRLTRANNVRAVRFPGAALSHETSFLVDEKPIQEYDAISILNEILYKTSNDVKPLLYKLYGEGVGHWERNHLETQEGHSFGGIVGPDSLATTSHKVHIHDDLQTPKAVQPATQLLIPTPFMFSTDISKSLCMAALPDTPKKIQYKTACLDQVFRPTFGNIFIQEEVTANPSALGVVIPSTPFRRIIRTSRNIPFLVPDSYIERDCCKGLQMRLLGTVLYVDDILHDMFVQKVGFNMIRLPVIQKTPKILDTSCGSCEDIQLYNSRWPTEWIIPRLIPAINRKKESIHYPDNWFEDAYVCNYYEYFNHTALSQVVNGLGFDYFHDIKALKTHIRSRKVSTLRSLGLRVLAYDFFNKQSIEYYRSLHPYNRGVNHFQALFYERIAPIISFQYNLFDEQVDNICNFSKARESYLSIGVNAHNYSNPNPCVTTSPCCVESCCDKNVFYLHIHMGAINFTVVVAGNFVVRFS
jgi:hypothetical protein